MVPFTYYFNLAIPDEKMRRMAMEEFAANGAEHLVIADGLLKAIAGTPQLYLKLPQEMHDAGLSFVDAHAPFGAETDPAVPVPEYRRQMLARLKFNLQIVSDFGVKCCCVHIGNSYYDGYTEEQHREATCRSLDEILPLAEKLDVTVCLENLTSICNHVDDVLFYMDKYASKHLGACFDAGHANIMEKGMNLPHCTGTLSFDKLGLPTRWEHDVLDRMLPHIVNCHLHDNDAASDQHILPGKGNIDWGKLVPKLLSAPRLMCVQSEVIPLRAQQPIRTLCEKFRELFGEI